jgi:hypothetical protein
MGAIADVQAALHVDARFGESLDFVDERRGIDDYSGTDDGVTAGAQDSARDELQNVAIGSNDDGVAGVMASGYARDIFKGASKVVNYFAFAFIAPLRAYHHDRVHF